MHNLWWSRRRVFVCLYGGMICLTVGWLGGYIGWIAQGCSLFFPFVSDLGIGKSGPLFNVCVVIGVVLWCPSWIDHFIIIRPSMHVPGACRCMDVLHHLMPVSGFFCCISAAGVALNPWDLRSQIHGMFAFGTFFGGVAFGALGTCIGYSLANHYRRSCVVLCFTAASLVMTFVFLGKAKEKFDPSMARYQFEDYCKGEGASMHSSSYINVAAVFEWILLAGSLLLAFIRLHWDLKGWSSNADAYPECMDLSN